jgi:hypothetical protein
MIIMMIFPAFLMSFFFPHKGGGQGRAGQGGGFAKQHLNFYIYFHKMAKTRHRKKKKKKKTHFMIMTGRQTGHESARVLTLHFKQKS